MWRMEDNLGSGWFPFSTYSDKDVAIEWLLYNAEKYPRVKWRLVRDN